MALADDRIARDLQAEVSDELARVGLIHRVFSRAKSTDSAQHKISSKGYSTTGKRLQDAIGVRVTTYFADDLDIATVALKNLYHDRFVDSTVDLPAEDSFRPMRINHIFRLLEVQAHQLSVIRAYGTVVDATFELQLRTVLSEGWHEVEHDYRYKCKPEWGDSADLSRALNGLIATLETCDWSMLQVFDELAMRHYRKRSWEAMLRNKYRLRFDGLPLGQELRSILDSTPPVVRQIFRSDRRKILSRLARSRCSLPITFDNIIFLVNHCEVHSSSVTQLVPEPIQDELQRLAV